MIQLHHGWKGAGLSETTHESHESPKFHTGCLWKTRALKFRREIDESESQTSASRTSRNEFANMIPQLRGLGMLNTITSGLASAITQLVGWSEKNCWDPAYSNDYGHLHFIQSKIRPKPKHQQCPRPSDLSQTSPCRKVRKEKRHFPELLQWQVNCSLS